MPVRPYRIRLPPETGEVALDQWIRDVTRALDDNLWSFRTTESSTSFRDEDQFVEVFGAGAVVSLPVPPQTGSRLLHLRNASGDTIFANVMQEGTINSATTQTVADGDSYTFYSSSSVWRIW